MKRLSLAVSMIFFACSCVLSQSPLYIPYQAVARNSAGNLLVNQNVSLRFTVHQSTSGGTTQYQETQSATTNNLGLFSVNVGAGTVVSGTFSGITWSDGNPKFMQVEIDPTGGTNYVSMGSTQMMSVPYALYAGIATASTGTLTNGSGITGGTYNGSSAVTWVVQALNGLNTNSTDNAVELGGTLTKSTTITQAGFNMIHNLTGTGDFEVEENSAPSLYILGDHGAATDGFVGIGIASPGAPLQVNSASSSALSSGLLNLFQPNLPANNTVYVKLGTGLSTNNETDLAFNYVSSGSTSNSMSIGFYGTGVISSFSANGKVNVADLAGAGYRPVFADGSGNLYTINAGATNNKKTFTSSTTWTVPTGVSVIFVKLWGAGGGGSYAGPGGGGGFVSGYLPVTAGSTLTIVVGSGGTEGGTSSTTGGGGAASGSGSAAGSGGGRSAIQITSGTDAVTAGGGGGGAEGCWCEGGGGGGGPIGGWNSTQQYAGIGGGLVVSTNSSYEGCGSSVIGAQYQGGKGCSSSYGGGGGGGYMGGDGGGDGGGNNYGGGGGSSYTGGLNSFLPIRNEQGGTNGANAERIAHVQINPAEYTDPDYSSGVGVGGAGDNVGGSASSGGNGYVVIYW